MSQNTNYTLEPDYNPEDRFKQYATVEPEFWKKKNLAEMSKTEWELLCDGCGKCCLNKLEIKGKIKFTNTHCRFLDCHSCLCKIYSHRFQKVPDCRDIDLAAIREKPRWLPKTCAYWLLDNGYDLPSLRRGGKRGRKVLSRMRKIGQQSNGEMSFVRQRRA